MLADLEWVDGAVEALSGAAMVRPKTNRATPRPKKSPANESRVKPPANEPLETMSLTPGATSFADDRSPEVSEVDDCHVPDETQTMDAVVDTSFTVPESGDSEVDDCQPGVETHYSDAVVDTNTPRTKSSPAAKRVKPPAMCDAKPSSPVPGATSFSDNLSEVSEVDDCHSPVGTLGIGAVVDTLIELHRRRRDMMQAVQRLNLQANAVCRRMEGGDKTRGGKLWKDVMRDKEHPMRIWLAPYLAAMEPLIVEKVATEKKMTKAAHDLPVFEWVKSVRGFGALNLAGIVGECAAPIGNYKSVAALWKRMGLAVISGERQRRVTGDAALMHGYNCERRSFMWNIGESLIKQQIRNPKGEDNKPIGDAYAIGHYGEVYLARKALEIAREVPKMHAHNRAKRYMEKRLLRDLYAAWRRADGLQGEDYQPAVLTN